MNSNLQTFAIHSKDAENYALGGMINYRQNLEIGCERLLANDFYFEENRVIFNAMKDLKARGDDTDLYMYERRLADFLQQESQKGFDYREYLSVLSMMSYHVDMES